MRIRKRNGTSYLRTDQGLWVRDFTSPGTHIDANTLTEAGDRDLLVANEVVNLAAHQAQQFEPRFTRGVAIVSDGHGFAKHLDAIQRLPPDVAVIGTNRALARWRVPGRPMQYYVANSPYGESLSALPTHGHFPQCVASVRTHPTFLRRYRGPVTLYEPAREERFGGRHRPWLPVFDDYRNPICAAVSLAHRLGAARVLLCCCDDSFADERPGAERLDNGLWMYPQHRLSHGLIDGMLHWLTRQEDRRVKAASFSHGPKMTNAPYIPADSLADFFAG